MLIDIYFGRSKVTVLQCFSHISSKEATHSRNTNARSVYRVLECTDAAFEYGMSGAHCIHYTDLMEKTLDKYMETTALVV